MARTKDSSRGKPSRRKRNYSSTMDTEQERKQASNMPVPSGKSQTTTLLEGMNGSKSEESDVADNVTTDIGGNDIEQGQLGNKKIVEGGNDSESAEDDEDMDAHVEDDEDDESAFETLAISDIPNQTIVDARNDAPALEKKLTEIAIFDEAASPKPLSFWESLSISLPLKNPLSNKLALEDLERERRLAEITAAAVHDGLDRLRQQRVKFRRPDDFFAEMIKSDEQMGKVKAQILFNKERIEAAEKRRNNRDIKKNRKNVRKEQIEKEQDKKRKTREEIEAYSRLRQQRLKQRAEGDQPSDDDEFPIDMLDVEQLDDENMFQKQKDIVSGKKKAWRPQNQSSQKGRILQRGGREDRRKAVRGNKDGGEQTGFNGKKTQSGGVQKRKKGPKKRLGKSRRSAGKGRS